MKTNKISRRDFLKHSILGTAMLGAGAVSITGSAGVLIQGCSKTKEYDVLVCSAMVFDGLGNPGRELDIAIKGDKIMQLGKNLDKKKAKLVIEARNLAVSPGFIDAHDHTDYSLLVNPKAENHIHQGVTSVISGNCGFSPFPIASSILQETKDYVKAGYDIDLNWSDITGFFQRILEKGTAINYGTLVGHGNIRGKILGLDDVQPTVKQLEEMKFLVEENMKAGALGISTGLEYAPGCYSQTTELVELCRVAARYRGVHATHMRSEGDALLESLEEAIEISRLTGIDLQISHFKVAYPKNWSKIDEALAKIEKARQEGIRILCDRYPYIAGATGLSYYFPYWAKQGTTKDFINRLKDPSLDAKLRSHLAEREVQLGSWENVLISSVFTQQNKKYEGKNVLQCAQESAKKPYEFIRDLLIEEESRVDMIIFFADENNLQRVLAYPPVVIGADGSASAPYGILAKGKPHPRLYGSFARVLGHYVREKKILSLEKAIQKMTSMTAQKFGLSGRGQLAEGYYADLVVFDPDKVIDRATWSDPYRYPDGIYSVIVNGQQVIREGEHTGILAGKILKH